MILCCDSSSFILELYHTYSSITNGSILVALAGHPAFIPMPKGRGPQPGVLLAQQAAAQAGGLSGRAFTGGRAAFNGTPPEGFGNFGPPPGGFHGTGAASGTKAGMIETLQVNSALLSYLEAHRGSAKYLFATMSSQMAAP